jgi:hypothetical protein
MRSSTWASRVVRRDSRASRLACFLVLAEGAARLVEHALDQAEQLFFLEGLLDEVHRALLHRRHGHRHVAVAGDEDHRQRALAFEQAVLQFEAAHAVHADVGDQAGHFARVEAREEGLGRVEALDAVVLALEQPLQESRTASSSSTT